MCLYLFPQNTVYLEKSNLFNHNSRLPRAASVQIASRKRRRASKLVSIQQAEIERACSFEWIKRNYWLFPEHHFLYSVLYQIKRDLAKNNLKMSAEISEN